LGLRCFLRFLILNTVGGTPWRGGSACRKATTYTGQHKGNKRTHIHASNGMRIHDPNIREGLRPRGHCDQQATYINSMV
jgi:hypothetical protein